MQLQNSRKRIAEGRNSLDVVKPGLHFLLLLLRSAPAPLLLLTRAGTASVWWSTASMFSRSCSVVSSSGWNLSVFFAKLDGLGG